MSERKLVRSILYQAPNTTTIITTSGEDSTDRTGFVEYISATLL